MGLLEQFKKQGYKPKTPLPWDWKLYLEDIFAHSLIYFEQDKAYDQKMIKKISDALQKVRER